MNVRSSVLITYAIILATIAVVSLQVLLCVKNYNEKKLVLKNELEFSLDKAIEMYYLEDALEEFITIIDRIPNRPFKSFVESIQFDTLAHRPVDSMNIMQDHKTHKIAITSYQIVKGRIKADSIEKLENRNNVMYFPLKNQEVKMTELNKRFINELNKKEIFIDYNLILTLKDSVVQKFDFNRGHSFPDTIFSQSIFLPDHSVLSMSFSNLTSMIWKRGWYEMALSFLFSSFIVACLVYLLKIINLQKINIETRNDFVSNITHEFKTPIATAFSALEAMQKFNKDTCPEKQLKYVTTAQIAITQLSHLSDKILETSAIENNSLTLHLKSENIVHVISDLIAEVTIEAFGKSLYFHTVSAKIYSDIDRFYFDSAMRNILDNAIKYGGSNITIDVNSTREAVIIEIKDDGKGIPKNYAIKIFEKFYRAPSSNVYEIRGYGVGLYFAQKIIESHGGYLILTSNQPPIFQIKLPHE